MSNFLLRQPYAVTTMRCAGGVLSVHEHRILLRVIEKLQPKMVLDKTPEQLAQEMRGDSLSFRLKDFVLEEGGSKSVYERVRGALEAMTRKRVAFTRTGKEGEKVETIAPLLAAVHLSEQGGWAKLSLSKEVLGQLLSLVGGFTRYNLKASFFCRSSHEARLYQLVCQFRKKKQGEFFLPVPLLRRVLSLQEKYGRVQEVLRCVLRPVSARLKQRAKEGTCDLWFAIKETYRDKYDRRRVRGWKIRIYSKESNAQRIKTEDKGDKKILGTLCSLGISPKDAQWMIKDVSHEKMWKAIYELKNELINTRIEKSKGDYAFVFLCRKFNLKR